MQSVTYRQGQGWRKDGGPREPQYSESDMYTAHSGRTPDCSVEDGRYGD